VLLVRFFGIWYDLACPDDVCVNKSEKAAQPVSKISGGCRLWYKSYVVPKRVIFKCYAILISLISVLFVSVCFNENLAL
jgi:hypothetical protein